MAKRQIKRNNKTATFFAEGGKKDVWGGISTALGGASGVLGSTMSMANTQLDPTVEANMDYNKTYQPTAYSNDALMEEWGNFSMLDHISRKQAGGKNAGSIAGGTLSGAGSGAAMGAGIGSIVPGIGTAIGAGVGAIFGGVSSLVGGLFGNNKAKRRLRRINKQIDSINDLNMRSFENRADSIGKQNSFNQMANFAAFGGPLHGGDFTNNVTFIGNGGTHELNPLGGVPMGLDQEGTPNFVEEGEVVFNNYVFSNRLFADKKLLEQFNLDKSYANHSFAMIAEKLSYESEERPNDPISKAGLEDAMNKLMQAQEQFKAEKEQKEATENLIAEEEIIDDPMIDDSMMDEAMMGGQEQMGLGMMMDMEGFAMGGNMFDDGGPMNSPYHRLQKDIEYLNTVTANHPEVQKELAQIRKEQGANAITDGVVQYYIKQVQDQMDDNLARQKAGYDRMTKIQKRSFDQLLIGNRKQEVRESHEKERKERKEREQAEILRRSQYNAEFQRIANDKIRAKRNEIKAENKRRMSAGEPLLEEGVDYKVEEITLNGNSNLYNLRKDIERVNNYKPSKSTASKPSQTTSSKAKSTAQKTKTEEPIAEKSKYEEPTAQKTKYEVDNIDYSFDKSIDFDPNNSENLINKANKEMRANALKNNLDGRDIKDVKRNKVQGIDANPIIDSFGQVDNSLKADLSQKETLMSNPGILETETMSGKNKYKRVQRNNSSINPLMRDDIGYDYSTMYNRTGNWNERIKAYNAAVDNQRKSDANYRKINPPVQPITTKEENTVYYEDDPRLTPRDPHSYAYGGNMFWPGGNMNTPRRVSLGGGKGLAINNGLDVFNRDRTVSSPFNMTIDTSFIDDSMSRVNAIMNQVKNADLSRIGSQQPQALTDPVMDHVLATTPKQDPSLTNNSPINVEQEIQLPDYAVGNAQTKKKGFDSTMLRYVPALGGAIGAFTDAMGWTGKPDYTAANIVGRSADNLANVKPSYLSNYMTYNPFDRDYYQNKINAQAGATRREIANQSGGNRMSAMAGLIAADNAYLNSIGDLGVKAEQYNLGQRQQVEDFNRATNMFNSQQDMQAQQLNLNNALARVNARAQQAQMMMQEDQLASQVKSANLTNMFNSLGNIGKEQFAMKMVNENPANYYTINKDGSISYKDEFYNLSKEGRKWAEKQAERDAKKKKSN